jgi:hypothetical protein
MAIGTSTLATASSSLKTLFEPPLIKQMNEKSGPVFKAIKKKSKQTVANEFVITMEYGRHGGIGARGEYDDLPQPSARLAAQGRVAPKNLYGRIALTEKLLLGARDNRMAFKDELSRQMKNVTIDANDMMRRNFCTDHFGVMGTVAAAVTADATITVTGKIGTFYEGQVIDILTPPSTFAIQGAQIINVDRVAGTFTLDRNVTATVGQSITLTGNYGNELTGLSEILTVDSVLYTIDRSHNKWFNPVVLDKTSVGGFDSMWLKAALDAVEDNTGETPKFYVCDRGVESAYVEEQLTYKRNVDYKTIDGGYNVLEYRGIPISAEKYFPDSQMALLSLDNMEFARLADWHFMDDDGKVLSRIKDKPAYEATMTCYAEVLCSKPGANALIKGITEAA